MVNRRGVQRPLLGSVPVCPLPIQDRCEDAAAVGTGRQGPLSLPARETRVFITQSALGGNGLSAGETCVAAARAPISSCWPSPDLARMTWRAEHCPSQPSGGWLWKPSGLSSSCEVRCCHHHGYGRALLPPLAAVMIVTQAPLGKKVVSCPSSQRMR